MTVHKLLKTYKGKSLSEKDLSEIDRIYNDEITNTENYIKRLKESVDKIKKDGTSFNDDHKQIAAKYPEFKIKEAEYIQNIGYVSKGYVIPKKYISKETKIEFKVIPGYSSPTLAYALYNKVGNNKLRIEGYRMVPIKDFVTGDANLWSYSSVRAGAKPAPSVVGLSFDKLIPNMLTTAVFHSNNIGVDVLGDILKENKKLYKKAIVKVIEEMNNNVHHKIDFVINKDMWLREEIEVLLTIS